jgi:predicted DNA-binding transcriptional regulator YafY
MSTLAGSGIPIEGERGVGYILRAPVSLPPMALNKDEFEALRIGMSLVATGADPTLAAAARSLRGKIGAVTPQGMQDDSAETFVYASPEAANATRHLGALRRALREHLYVDVTPLGAAQTERIRPLHLEFWAQVWTLTCWSEYQSDFKVFRVDLISDLSIKGGAFLPENGKTLNDFVTRLTAQR